MTINVPFKILKHGEGFPKPSYQSIGSSGIDLYAALKKTLLLSSFSRDMIPTGLCFEIPHGYEGQIRPRSGLFINSGIMAMFGTIDSDFRGEIKILLVNFTSSDFEINPGMRIGQIIINKIEKINLIQSNILTKTKRGEKGFGSTGK